MSYQEYLTPIFSSSAETDGVRLKSTSEYGSSYAVWKAFTRTAATASDCWLSATFPTSDSPEGIEIDFTGKASPVCITSYSFQGRYYDAGGGAPEVWRLEVLLDATVHGKAEWVCLHSAIDGLSLKNAALSPTYVIPYRYSIPLWIRKVRLVVWKGTEAYVALSDLKLSGYNNIATDTPSYTPHAKWLWQVDVKRVAPDADILVGIAPATRDMTVALSPTEQGLFRFTHTLNYGDRLFFALDTKLKQLTCWHSMLDKIGTITYDFSGADVVPILGDIGSSGEVLPTITGQQVFTQSGEFTVPEFVTSVDVMVVGGGGPGCQSVSADPRGGGSGGEVIYQTGVVLPVGVSTLPIMVGNSSQPSSFGILVTARAGNVGVGSTGGASITGDGVGQGGNASLNGANGVDMSAIVGTELGESGWFGGGGGGGGLMNMKTPSLNQPAGLGSEHGGGADGRYEGTPLSGQANTGGGGGGGLLYYSAVQGKYLYQYPGSLGGSGIVVVKWSISNAQYTNEFKFNLGRQEVFSMRGVVREYDKLTLEGYAPYDGTEISPWFQPYVIPLRGNVLCQIVV